MDDILNDGIEEYLCAECQQALVDGEPFVVCGISGALLIGYNASLPWQEMVIQLRVPDSAEQFMEGVRH